MILLGDSLEVLKMLPENSVDAVVTDPPYGLKFMGKKWDSDVPTSLLWESVLRVLKPGGHLLSFCGTRTYHRLVVAIEDAGFEIRDQIQWIYGSGFPKSMDVSKAIDRAAGAEREVVGVHHRHGGGKLKSGSMAGELGTASELPLTAPATPDAIKWQGFGTALKPANEPIVLARKPLSESTVAKNVLKWGVGALNIDGSRIEAADQAVLDAAVKRMTGNAANNGAFQSSAQIKPNSAQGRWPANVIFDEAAVEGHEWERFFYCAKASKAERNRGMGDIEAKESGVKNDSGRGFSEGDPYKKVLNQNNHPTVKPIKLMEYLVRLVTPPNGTVLDPFMGSGSTGVACKNLGFEFIGIEMNAEYVEIAKKRCE